MGIKFSKRAITDALNLVRWYRAFIRSDKNAARIPGDWTKQTMTREQAQTRLWEMIERTINYRADGHSSKPRGRKDQYDYQTSLYRDCQRVRDRINSRISVYQFETQEIRQRFSHLLSRYDD